MFWAITCVWLICWLLIVLWQIFHANSRPEQVQQKIAILQKWEGNRSWIETKQLSFHSSYYSPTFFSKSTEVVFNVQAFSKYAHAKCSLQHNVIKFLNYLQKVYCFPQVLWFPKSTNTDIWSPMKHWSIEIRHDFTAWEYATRRAR